MEYMLDFKLYIILEFNGFFYIVQLKLENCKKLIIWEYKYMVVYIDFLNLLIIFGGMNNVGLLVSVLMFFGFVRYQVDIKGGLWNNYILVLFIIVFNYFLV